MNKAIVALCSAVALVSSGATAAPAGALADCQKGAEAWNDAFNKHDAEALANMYDAKAGMFSNDYWTGTGHDALLAGFKQMVAAGLTEASVKCEHTTHEGDIVVYDGTYALSGKAPDGKDVSAAGHWIVVDKNGVILTHFADEQRQPPPK
jgi:ketosteroid isomerase-like protein